MKFIISSQCSRCDACRTVALARDRMLRQRSMVRRAGPETYAAERDSVRMKSSAPLVPAA